MAPFRKIILLISALLAAGFSHAQKIRFTAANSWTVYQVDVDQYSSYNSFGYTGDTLIHDTLYQKLFGATWNGDYWGYIREDTITGIVYYRSYGCCIDTSEQILYDYNWQVGDSILKRQYHHYVAGIDSVEINNKIYKVWYIKMGHNFSATTDYYVIEGIGSTHGPTFPINPDQFEQVYTLTCFVNSDITSALVPAVDGFDNLTSCALSVQTGRRYSQHVTTIPNPANDYAQLLFRNNIKSGKVTVYNSLGERVLSAPINNTDHFSLGDCVRIPGIYFYSVVDNNSIYTGNFLRQ